MDIIFQSSSKLDRLSEYFLHPFGFLCCTILGRENYKVYRIQNDDVQQIHYPEVSRMQKCCKGVFCAMVVVPATLLGLLCKTFFSLTKAGRHTIDVWRSFQLVPPCTTQGGDFVAVQQGPITTGQGEYVVFRQSAEGTVTPLTQEQFEEIFDILDARSSVRLAIHQPDSCAARYELITKTIQKIDPCYQVVFIPKTFYELMYIEKCIQEDLDRKKVCFFVVPWTHETTEQELVDVCRKEREKLEEACWHLCHFTKTETDSSLQKVKTLAHRLNQVAIEHLQKKPGSTTPLQALNYHQWTQLLHEKIAFLKNMREQAKNINTGGGYYGPAVSFGSEYPPAHPMGIRNDADAQLVQNALKLDCSTMALDSLFIYRGSDFQKDSAIDRSDSNRPYSLSYGTGILAGSVFDGGATALHYMRNQKNAYAIPIPLKDLVDSPFFVPKDHTLVQLCGNGEAFHSRTKAWVGSDLHEISGINIGRNSCKRDHLASKLHRDEFIAKFNAFKAKAIQLK